MGVEMCADHWGPDTSPTGGTHTFNTSFSTATVSLGSYPTGAIVSFGGNAPDFSGVVPARSQRPGRAKRQAAAVRVRSGRIETLHPTKGWRRGGRFLPEILGSSLRFARE